MPLAKIASKIMMGVNLNEQNVTTNKASQYFAVKEAVFPFSKFYGVDTILGPEMKSTGEVMGVGKTFGEAFIKSQLGAGIIFPEEISGKLAFLSVRNTDKPQAVNIAKKLKKLGFNLVATRGTAKFIAENGISVEIVNKVAEGRPHVVDMIKSGQISFILNTVEERKSAIRDSRSIRTSALSEAVTTYTTIAGARAAVDGLSSLAAQKIEVYDLKSIH
jgi:carbamoyl-phosphate synthase large subunit